MSLFFHPYLPPPLYAAELSAGGRKQRPLQRLIVCFKCALGNKDDRCLPGRLPACLPTSLPGFPKVPLAHRLWSVPDVCSSFCHSCASSVLPPNPSLPRPTTPHSPTSRSPLLRGGQISCLPACGCARALRKPTPLQTIVTRHSSLFGSR